MDSCGIDESRRDHHVALGKRASASLECAEDGCAKKEKIQSDLVYTQSIRSNVQDDDDDEDEEINVVDTSDVESNSGDSPNLTGHHLTPIIQSMNINSNNTDRNTRLYLPPYRNSSVVTGLETPLDLSYKKSAATTTDHNNIDLPASHFCSSSSSLMNGKGCFATTAVRENNSGQNIISSFGSQSRKKPDRRSSLLNQNRPSVIRQPEVCFYHEFPDVEEHFRKSLACRAVSTGTQPNVEDHFARALGSVWPHVNNGNMNKDSNSDLCGH